MKQKSYDGTLIWYLVKEFDIKNPILDGAPKTIKGVTNELDKLYPKSMNLTKIRNMVKWIVKRYKKIESNPDERALNRAKDIKNIVESISSSSITNYYDLGCGNGIITEAIGKEFGLTKSHIFGIDMFPAQANITSLRPEESKLVPSNFVNLITAFVSLHHISPLGPVLDELDRIATEGCILIIREHDTDSLITSQFLNKYHAMMMMTGVGELSEAGINLDDWKIAKPIIEDYMESIKYHKLEDWIKILEVHNFKFIDSKKYEGNNPQQLFYAVFRK